MNRHIPNNETKVTSQVIIYCLINPIDASVFYIGKTQVGLNKRLSLHLCMARNPDDKHYSEDMKRTPTCKYIRRLLHNGYEPIMREVETVKWEDWRGAEQYWINHYLEIGCKLTNAHPGGGGR